MSKIKNCPFCGGEIEEKFDIYTVTRTKDNRTLWVVNHYCEHKGVDNFLSVNAYGLTREEAIDLWNRRAADVQEHIA